MKKSLLAATALLSVSQSISYAQESPQNEVAWQAGIAQSRLGNSWHQSGVRNSHLLVREQIPFDLLIEQQGERVYFIDPQSGNDEHDGRKRTPWRSLSAANARLKPGDIVYLREGEYSEQIRPARSGSAKAHIAYIGYPGETARFIGDRQGRLKVADLNNRSYIIVANLRADGKPSAEDLKAQLNQTARAHAGAEPDYRDNNHLARFDSWITLQYVSQHNIVAYNRFEHARGWAGIELGNWNNNNDTRNNIFYRNYFDKVGQYDSCGYDKSRCEGSTRGGWGDDDGDLFYGTCANNNLILDNYIGYGGHSSIVLRGVGNLLINNLINGSAAPLISDSYYQARVPQQYPKAVLGNHPLELKNFACPIPWRGAWEQAGQHLVEGNTIINAGVSADLQNNMAAKADGNDNVFRHNLFDRSYYDGIWHMAAEKTLNIGNSKFYNNTFSRIGHNNPDGAGIGIFIGKFRGPGSDHWSNTGNNLLNNLFNHVKDAIRHPNWESSVGQNIEHNGFFQTEGEGESAIVIDESPVRDQSWSLFSAYQSEPESPLIDQGQYLTQTLEAGQGHALPVEDSTYFSDGRGLIPGDLIQLAGQSQRARVIGKPDRHTLRLDQALSWQAGQGVSLAYGGKRPDIGLIESGLADASDNEPLPPPTEPKRVNQPPKVTLSGPERLAYGASLSPIVSLSDDQDRKQLTLHWQDTEGLGVVSFTHTDQAQTQIRFSLPGYYTLTLTASDAEGLSHSDSLRVFVEPEPDPSPETNPEPQAASSEPTVAPETPPQDKPVILGPRGKLVADKVRFSWQPVAKATRYRLTHKDAKGVLHQPEFELEQLDCNPARCQVQLDQALPSGAMYFRVLPGNAHGWGTVSDRAHFTLESPLKAPTQVSQLLAPVGNIPQADLRFEWTPVAQASRYQLIYRDGRGQQSEQTLLLDQLTCETLRCHWSPPTPLAFGSGYFRVLAGNQAGWGPSSHRADFQVIEPVSAGSGNTHPSISLGLNRSANLDQTIRFTAQIADQETALGELDIDWRLGFRGETVDVAANQGLAALSFALEGQYTLSVTVTDPQGLSSTKTITIAASQLSTPPTGTATLYGPRGHNVARDPLFSWSPVPNATRYRLTHRGSDGVLRQPEFDAEALDCNQNRCQVKTGIPLPSGTAYFRILPGNAAGWGQVSPRQYFTIN